MDFGAGFFSDEELAQFSNALCSETKKLTGARVSNETHLEKTSEIFVGLPQWGVSEWKGSLYPEGCPPQRFLSEYAKNLNCVEVSSTFYSDVSPATIEKWTNAVADDFHFLPKWPQQITHVKNLKDCQKETAVFLRRLECFGDNLGTSILQLPPGFSTEFRSVLFHFLESLPEGLSLAIELRHKSWFVENKLYQQFEEYLLKREFGTVCSDTPSRRDVFHLSFSGSKNIIRYLSDRSESTDNIRLKTWKDFLSHARQSTFYFTLHRPDNERSPELISMFDPERAQNIEESLAGPQVSLF